jgi:protoporphyrinogen oxidase
LAVTVEEAGYRFDRTGHLLHLRDPETRSLVERWVGAESLTVQRRSVVWSHGVYTRYPFQANTHGLPPSVAYECLLGFVAAHFAAHPSPPEDFEQFCLQTFGEGISRHFMLPYNTRLWGVPANELTASWCERFVPKPRLEDVVAGAVGLRDRELGYNSTFLYPRHGIGTLTEALHREVPHVELSRAPTRIDHENRSLSFRDEVVEYGTLISTAPLPELIQLLDQPPADVQRAARALRHNPLYYLDVALDTPCEKPYHWVYVPESRYAFYRVGCYSHFSPAMAPPNKASLYVELVDRREPDLDELLPRVATQLTEMGLISSPASIAFARLRRLDHAYVIFDHAHASAVARIHEFLADAGIISAGRFGEWTYSSMEDALIAGREAARRAERWLR